MIEKKSFLLKTKLILSAALMAIMCAMIVPASSQANFLPIKDDLKKKYTEDIGLPTFATGKALDGQNSEAASTGVGLLKNAIFTIAYYLKFIIGALAIFYVVFAGLRIVISSHNEETVSNMKMNLLWIMIGLALVMSAETFMKGFSLEDGAQFINDPTKTKVIQDKILIVVNFLKYILGAVATFYMFFSGMRMVTSQGNEEVIDEQKKDFAWGFFGLLMVMMLEPILKTVYEVNYAASTKVEISQTPSGTVSLVLDMVNFFLTMIGALGVLFLVASGIIYVTAFGDEERTGQAKKAIIGSLIGLVMVYSAYTFVRAFAMG